MGCRSLLGVVVLAVCSVPAQALAQSTRLEAGQGFRPFDTTQYVGVGVMAAGLVGTKLWLHSPDNAAWRSEILFDREARASLGAGSANARATASEVSDYLRLTLVLYPLLIDSWVVAGQLHRSPALAFQMTAISLQSLMLTELSAGLTKNAVARQRPDAGSCEGEGCARSPNASFFSGHTSTAFAGAGLVCAHHQNLPLYGGGVGDAAACGMAVAMATAVGTLRVVADRHHLSDVVVGAAVGTLSGYVLPNLTNYDFGASRTDVSRSAILPLATSRVLGVSYLYQF